MSASLSPRDGSGDVSLPSPSRPGTPHAIAAPLIACHECDHLFVVPPLKEDERALCGRCGAQLFVNKPRTIQRTLALYIASAVLLVAAATLPFMTLSAQGREQTSHLITGVTLLYEDGLPEVAVVVLTVIFLAPLLKILCGLYVLLPLLAGFRPPFAALALRAMQTARNWAMIEVYILAVFVSYVKLVDMARVHLDYGVFAFMALMATLAWTDAALEPRTVWERLQPTPLLPIPPRGKSHGLVTCHGCGLLVDGARLPVGHRGECPRCGAGLHHRKPNGIARAWALIFAAIIMYLPANLFPVMEVVSLGSAQADTIMSGVIYLINAHMWPLALLIFFASITVPVLKLLGLGFLLISVQRRSRWRPRERTQLYRIVEGIGRWSMVDVFVVAILVSVVRFGNLATIHAEVGVIAFCSVVVFTMVGAMSFDPRSIWDAAGANDDR